MKNYAHYFLDIGTGAPIVRGEIIAVFDLDRAETSGQMNEFLRSASAAGRIRAADGYEIPKTLIVTTSGLFLSPLNADTVGRRIGE